MRVRGARVLIKICGLTSRADAELAIAAGADLVGFVFVPGTPRAVDPDRARWIRDLRGAERVGVFRDAPLAQVLAIRDQLDLDRVQLHGAEPDDWLATIGRGVIRRLPVPGAVDWPRAAALAARGVLPLLDPGAGDGRAFDWRQLADRPSGLGFGLAGGLTPATVGAAIRRAHPILVDVSSGVEVSPGVKDPALMRAFVAAAQRRDHDAP